MEEVQFFRPTPKGTLTLLATMRALAAPTTDHPRLRGANADGACPHCGNSESVECGQAATGISLYEARRCVSCGGVFRDGKRVWGVGVRGVAV